MDDNSDEVINPTLPGYLQKYIIKLLCNHINSNNRLIEPISVDLDYRSLESESKKLTLKLSLVSNLWFNTVSNNLYVSIDFNYSDTKYSINKANNMTVLKLHFNHPEDYYYKMIKGIETPIKVEEINEKIKELKSLEKIVYRNININNSESHQLEFIDLITHNITEPDGIEILEAEINSTTNKIKLDQLKKKISKIFSIIFNSCSSKDIIFEVLKVWSPSIHQFYVISHQSSILPFPWTSLSNQGYLKNILYYEIYGVELRLSNLTTILKSSPQIKHLSFSCCLDRLVYYTKKLGKPFKSLEDDILEKVDLNNDDLNESSDEEEEDDEEENDLKCTCNSIIFNKTNINYYNDIKYEDNQDDEKPFGIEVEEENEDEEMEILKFRNDWLAFCKQIKNSRTLEYLHIGQECLDHGEVTIRYQQSEALPIEFIQQVGKMVSSIPSLKKISTLGINSPELFKFISNNNKIIKNYYYLESIMEDSSYIHENHTTTFNNLIEKNPQIKEFKYKKFIFSIEQQIIEDIQNGIQELNQQNLNNILSFKEENVLDFKK